MNERTAPQFHVKAVVECPVCGGWTEAPDEVPVVRCETCRVEVRVVEPEPAVHRRAA